MQQDQRKISSVVTCSLSGKSSTAGTFYRKGWDKTHQYTPTSRGEAIGQAGWGWVGAHVQEPTDRGRVLNVSYKRLQWEHGEYWSHLSKKPAVSRCTLIEKKSWLEYGKRDKTVSHNMQRVSTRYIESNLWFSVVSGCECPRSSFLPLFSTWAFRWLSPIAFDTTSLDKEGNQGKYSKFYFVQIKGPHRPGFKQGWIISGKHVRQCMNHSAT